MRRRQECNSKSCLNNECHTFLLGFIQEYDEQVCGWFKWCCCNWEQVCGWCKKWCCRKGWQRILLLNSEEVNNHKKRNSIYEGERDAEKEREALGPTTGSSLDISFFMVLWFISETLYVHVYNMQRILKMLVHIKSIENIISTRFLTIMILYRYGGIVSQYFIVLSLL